MNQSNSSFFGTFNARHFNPEEVASQFVPSERFWKLVALRNSVLVGPRGSGKTHLLKMLQPKALAHWNHKDAERARNEVQFHGVFISADVNWKTQIRQRQESLSPSNSTKYGLAVFISHLREALISCMLQLTHDRPKEDSTKFLLHKLTSKQEMELVETIARSWKLVPTVYSLLGLRQSIVDQISDLSLSRIHSESALVEFLRNFQPDVLSTARQAIEAFSSVTKNFDARWALCFDELEIAPPEIQEELLACLRSTDQRIIFKLAISPFNLNTSVLNQITTASPGNDYDPISLWFTDLRETNQFCRELWDQQTKGTIAAPFAPRVILGQSKFHATESQTPGSKYNENSVWSRAFKSLASKDRSFAEYLQRKNVDPTALSKVERRLMDSVVRKIAPIVGFRDAYLAENKIGDKNLERKVIKSLPPDVFSGWEALCILTEGNPRWFNGLVNRLIMKWISNGRSLSIAAQAKEFEIASEKFLALISTVPINSANLEPELEGGLRSLTKMLGEYFSDEILSQPFSADPILAFTVSEQISSTTRELITIALNVGAIVSMDEHEVDLTLSNLTGHRFRLVHLLAPIYKLPLKTGKSRNLDSILRGHRQKFSNLGSSKTEHRFASGKGDSIVEIQKDLFNGKL